MLSLSITDVKPFMAKLLKTEIFDDFNLHNITIHNTACFEISKISNENVPKWADVRPFVFEVIKGGKTPSYIKMVFSLNADTIGLDDALLFLNIVFEDANINISTGISHKNFTLDRSGYIKWNEYILKFLNNADISYADRLL